MFRSKAREKCWLKVEILISNLLQMSFSPATNIWETCPCLPPTVNLVSLLFDWTPVMKSNANHVRWMSTQFSNSSLVDQFFWPGLIWYLLFIVLGQPLGKLRLQFANNVWHDNHGIAPVSQVFPIVKPIFNAIKINFIRQKIWNKVTHGFLRRFFTHS